MKVVIISLFIIFPLLSILFLGSNFFGISVGVVLDVILLLSGVRVVKQNTVQLVEFLGKFNRILHSGFSVVIPFLEKTRTQFLFKRNMQVMVEGLTGDNVTTKIGLNVVYYVKDKAEDIYSSVYEIDSPELLIKATIDEQLRSMVTEFTHKDIYTKRGEIGHAIEKNLALKLSQFGYTLDSIQVQDIQLDSNVLKALNKIIETEKLKEAALNEAEAKRIRLVKEAEADKESKKLIGEGMAEQRKAIAEGFKESVDMIKSSDKNLTGDAVLRFLLDSARIETLEKVGKGDKTKIIYMNENLEAQGGNKIEKLLADK